MIVKVCGINSQRALDMLQGIDLDMIGLNFYPSSKRFLTQKLNFSNFNPAVKKVGVFVNASKKEILALSGLHDLDYAQLHGDEDINFCQSISEKIKVIKVFRVNQTLETIDWNLYNFVSYNLFDKKDPNYGGSGEKFNWQILQNYSSSNPFLLSGGIGPDDAEEIQKINIDAFHGVDVNSRFETKPGTKDPYALQRFIKSLKS